MATQTGAHLPPRPSIQQAADFHGVDPKTIRRYIARGLITADRIGPRLIRLDRDSVLNLGRRIRGAASTSDVGLEITAHHESGHAVAVLLRGDAQLHYIDLNPTDDYQGYTHFASKPWDRAFIIYAGPWAEARAQWSLPTTEGEDDDGCTFDDHVAGAFLANIDGDAATYKAALNADPTHIAAFQGRCEEVWNRELERYWPVVRKVARLRLSEGADNYHSPTHLTWHDTIANLLSEHEDAA